MFNSNVLIYITWDLDGVDGVPNLCQGKRKRLQEWTNTTDTHYSVWLQMEWLNPFGQNHC